MFCRCPNESGGEPNTRICPVCTAQPGRAAGGQPRGRRAHDRGRARAGLARSRRTRRSTARTTSIPTRPRRTRSASTTNRSAAAVSWPCRRPTATTSWASSACTSRRTPPRRSTRAAAAGAWPARTAPWSTSTAAARRCMEMVTRARPALARAGLALRLVPARDDRGARASRSATWRRGRCASTPTSACAVPARTSCAPKTELKNMNSFSFLERGIARELRRQAELYEAGEEFVDADAALRPGARTSSPCCAPRSWRTTTATSRSPTSCRSSPRRSSIDGLRARAARAARGARAPLRERVRAAARAGARPRHRQRAGGVLRGGRGGLRRRARRRPTGCSTSSRRTSTRRA